ncbi:MAG: PD40 domain-containing protein [Chloroflexi bacterium]|nr:PD40 domain-containing protein [Chloroflexota bacterium]MBP8057127.1 PD40 domain-containing protein [Chloroflexota bacterium]
MMLLRQRIVHRWFILLILLSIFTITPNSKVFKNLLLHTALLPTGVLEQFAPIQAMQTAPTQLIRISVGVDGKEANNWSVDPAISADGRYIAFRSAASNLVLNDTNGYVDVFVYDRETSQTVRVSVASDGTEANAFSACPPSISANGRYVAFDSRADNLVADDTNGIPDNFVHDRETGTTTRITVLHDSPQAWHECPILAADGHFILFSSAANSNSFTAIFIYNTETGETEPLSVKAQGTQTNGLAFVDAASADGRYIVFRSNAINLVMEDRNEDYDVFVNDRETGQTSRVSIRSDGGEANSGSYGPAISGDGRYVIFASFADNLIDNDFGESGDVFVHDRQTGQTLRISELPEDAQLQDEARSSSTGTISSDGRYAAFYRWPNFRRPELPYGFFIYDLTTHEVHGVAKAYSEDPLLSRGVFSSDGHYFVFASEEPLAPDDTNNQLDIYFYENVAYRLPEAEPTATLTATPVEPTATPRPLPTDTVTVVATSSATVPTTVTPAPTGTPLTESTPSTGNWLSGVLVVLGLVVVGGAGFLFLTRAR